MSEMRQVWISSARHVHPDREVAGFADDSGVPFAPEQSWGDLATCSAQFDLATNTDFRMADTCVLVLCEYALPGESLGQSHDAPTRVHEEIEAARVAVDGPSQEAHCDGSKAYVNDYDLPQLPRLAWRAGWLAAAMVLHEDPSC